MWFALQLCSATFAGAGAGIARRFAREGYKVALISRRQESIAPVEKELRASGAETLAVPCDTGRHACATAIQGPSPVT